MRAFMVFLLTIALGMLIIPPLAMAHGGLEHDIVALDRTLSVHPGSIPALLHRADLLRLQGEFGRALQDLERVERLQPASPEAAWVRARIMVDQRREAAALADLDRWLEAHPEHLAALSLRARVHAFVGDADQAVRDYSLAILHSRPADPELFTARAEIQQAQGRSAEALAGLEQGMNQLGPLLSLQIPALELELSMGREANALERMGHIIAGVPRKEGWLARRAELLERLGRRDDARRDWLAAVAACKALPSAQRNSRAIQMLLERARDSVDDSKSLQS